MAVGLGVWKYLYMKKHMTPYCWHWFRSEAEHEQVLYDFAHICTRLSCFRQRQKVREVILKKREENGDDDM
jgi:hypothetical protein